MVFPLICRELSRGIEPQHLINLIVCTPDSVFSATGDSVTLTIQFSLESAYSVS